MTGPDVATVTEAVAPPARKGSLRWPGGESLAMLLVAPVVVIAVFVGYVWWHHSATLDATESSILAWSAIRDELIQHVKLTAIASAIVVVIAVPAGVILTRGRARAAAPVVVGIANTGQAAPSIGLLALFFIWLGPGMLPAIVGLSLYGLLPVLRNTITGLQGVDPTLVEAGRGMGMSAASTLFRIELRLALPVIMAGVRTALVLVVGTAALATLIGGGGLGDALNSAISLSRPRAMIASAVLIALLALLVEWIGRVLELVFRPKGI